MRNNTKKNITETVKQFRISDNKANIKKDTTLMNYTRIATINVRTLQDDFKLATIVQTARSLCIDVLAIQEGRGTLTGSIVVDDEGWKIVWSGHKQKRGHDVSRLMAPHVKIEEQESYQQQSVLKARGLQ